MEKNTFIDYRERLMDPISSSFCAAKWYNASIWLHTGMTTSCHLPPAHFIPIAEIKENYRAIHNTKHKMKMRELMLDGHRPSECDYCWKVEDIKRDNVSDRIFKTIIYKDKDVRALSNRDYPNFVNLKTLELVFDNTCNLACSYCNADFSTSWGKDIKINGPYKNITCKEAGTFSNAGELASTLKKDDNNPYVEAFWKWWPELSETLEELRITGGEPLMSDNVWKIFEEFKTTKPKMRLAVNSNLSAKRELINRLIENSQLIDDLVIYTSMESVGDQAEYIRDGLDYNLWVENVNNVLSNAKISSFNIMMTINSLCLFKLTEQLDFCMELKRKYGRRMGVFTLNILRFPAFMSLAVLPTEIKNTQRLKLVDWLETNKNDPMLHDLERDSVQRLIDYIDTVDLPYDGAEDNGINLKSDIKSFFSQYDIRRSKNINVFPKEFVDWYNTL